MSGSQATGRRKDQAVYTLRIDRDKLERLRELTAHEHRTVQQEIRWLIDQRITILSLGEQS